MLILPQILEICRQKRVRGISYSLLFLNLIGDLFKTVYFFINVPLSAARTNPFSSNYAGSYS